MQKDYIALNINHLVFKEKLKKDAFGKLFNLNRGAIASYIEEKAKPKLETLQKISAKYDLLLDDLVNKKFSEWTPSAQAKNNIANGNHIGGDVSNVNIGNGTLTVQGKEYKSENEQLKKEIEKLKDELMKMKDKYISLLEKK